MLVGVALPRGVSLIVALLGVLKAGAAYLPIDLAAPPARIAGTLAAVGARLVVSDAATTARLPADGYAEVLDVAVLAWGDTLLAGGHPRAPDGPGPPAASPASAGPDAPSPARVHPLHLAYVGYTSGSTGTPKGVAIPHRAIVRLVSDPDFARLGPGQRVLQLAPAAFDASTLEIWGALCTGATLVIAPPDPLGFAELGALLRGGQVTVAWLTAGLFHQLAEAEIAALAEVGQLLTGGDVVSPALLRAVLAARDGRPVVNGYGPTENTTFTTCHVMTGQDGIGERAPVGRPVPGTTVQVLDEDLRPVPVGVPGELYAGGDGLARCYLGDPAATARSFVPDPGAVGERLYRTGDLARWRADGVLEFLGRRDDQVKIRGFRMEPAEVETVLASHPGVGAAAVKASGEGADRHLVAYVTPAGGAAPTTAALREHAQARLPAYLVPAAYVVLPGLPLTPNGKVDRAALPTAVARRKDVSQAAAGPATPTERRLARLWSALLPGDHAQPGAQRGVPGGRPPGEALPRDVSFFTLGGNSLTAARLVSTAREEFGVDLALGALHDEPTLRAMAARIDAASPAPADDAANRPALRRRDRDAHRVVESRTAPGHLIRLSDDWALWRTVCLRGAGFPVDLVAALGDAELARAADAANAVADSAAAEHAPAGGTAAANAVADSAVAEHAPVGGADSKAAAYQAEFGRAVLRLSHALAEAAMRPAFREAVTWQNPHALETGVDALLRRDPDAAVRNAKHRQHETLVASYLQRYCVKNDTIGFFGPVGWASFRAGDGISVSHARPAAVPFRGDDPPEPPAALVSARTTYLEGWAVAAVMAPHTAALRPWLAPRRMPYIDVVGDNLRVPLAPPVPLTPAQAAVLRACDGERDARGVAELVLADAALARTGTGPACADEVLAMLDAAARDRRIAWRVEVPPHDTRPEETVRAMLARVTDDAVRAAATASLDELCAARDALAGAAGSPKQVAAAMAGLEQTFTRLSGSAPTRRAGGLYAGRTAAYEDCKRADAVEFGEATLDPVRDALGLVLDSARWFTAAGAALYRRLFEEVHRRRAAELGADVVPFADFWMRIPEILFGSPDRVTAPLARGLQRRWAQVLALPAEHQGRVTRTSAQIAAGVRAAFPASRPGWPTAVQHSPDLMIAADPSGGMQWVLGELHPGINTLRYATWVAHHPAAAELRAAMASDLRRSVVYAAETGEEGGMPARQSNALANARDLRFVFAHDSFGHGKAATLPVGECDLAATPAGLRVRRRDGSADLDLIEVLGDLIGAALSQQFKMLAPAAHVPRVTIDGLVVSRESWTFGAADLAFAGATDEAGRYLQARAWAARTGLPRHVFVRAAGEGKPVYADLTSLASVDLLARSVRRARRHAGDAAPVTLTEMLPAPDQLWLTDSLGHRYSAELRVVAVDRWEG